MVWFLVILTDILWESPHILHRLQNVQEGEVHISQWVSEGDADWCHPHCEHI